MEQADGPQREIAELRDRLSRLSQASLRINESLDFDTVLQGVLDSACSLTGARYGVITLLDESGQVQDVVTSGLTAEEHRRFTDLPEGMMFFQYLSNIQEPLRLRDFHSHIRSLGLPEFQPPMTVSTPLPFLAAPIRHLGESVGAFYVGEKEVEFTPRRRGDSGHVRLPSGAGHRQRPQAPGRAAGQGRHGDPGEHYSRGRPGVRREDGRRDVGQPGGQEDGVGRTGAVVGCWLVRHGRMGDAALQQVAEWWQGVERVWLIPNPPETPEQKAYVRKWTESSPVG